MTEIDVVQDLNTVTEQVQKLNSQLQETNNQSAVLVQQIQNLNGVLMYLRGKEVSSESVNETVVEDSSNSEE